jgi:demethylmenaquinone methyltransferase/2-methoxy-6-polyprenyl-1,4-benzoquinol methylase
MASGRGGLAPKQRGTGGDELSRLTGEAARDAVYAPGPDEKATAIRRMFSLVAPRYDLLNHLLSLNIDRRWRRRAIDRLLERCRPDGVVLDACAGTLDLAVELARRPGFRGRVVASDFSLPMLEQGRGKTPGLRLNVTCGDALRLPFRDAALDGATVGFGVRNLGSLDAGLRELARVLRPGAPLVILEFATPQRQPLRAAYLFYFRRLLPLIGKVVSGHGGAYAYLPASVLNFPEPEALSRRMVAAGFADIRWELLTGGIAAIHVGSRAAGV